MMLFQNYTMKDLTAYKKFLNENHAIPLYYQLELIIENYLDIEDIPAGQPFFSEEEIAKQLDVSRPTVNKALRNLIKKGYLIRSRSKRSMVNKINLIPLVVLQELDSFGEMIKKHNINTEYKTKLIERKIIKPNNKVIEYLKLSEDEDILFLKRLRYINQKPLIVVDSYLSFKNYRKLYEIQPTEFHKDLYNLAKELFNINIYRSDRSITAKRMTLEDASLLNEEIWEPCLRIEAVSYTENNKPFEYFDSRFKGDSCILKTKLIRT